MTELLLLLVAGARSRAVVRFFLLAFPSFSLLDIVMRHARIIAKLGIPIIMRTVESTMKVYEYIMCLLF